MRAIFSTIQTGCVLGCLLLTFILMVSAPRLAAARAGAGDPQDYGFDGKEAAANNGGGSSGVDDSSRSSGGKESYGDGVTSGSGDKKGGYSGSGDDSSGVDNATRGSGDKSFGDSGNVTKVSPATDDDVRGDTAVNKNGSDGGSVTFVDRVRNISSATAERVRDFASTVSAQATGVLNTLARAVGVTRVAPDETYTDLSFNADTVDSDYQPISPHVTYRSAPVDYTRYQNDVQRQPAEPSPSEPQLTTARELIPVDAATITAAQDEIDITITVTDRRTGTRQQFDNPEKIELTEEELANVNITMTWDAGPQAVGSIVRGVPVTEVVKSTGEAAVAVPNNGAVVGVAVKRDGANDGIVSVAEYVEISISGKEQPVDVQALEARQLVTKRQYAQAPAPTTIPTTPSGPGLAENFGGTPIDVPTDSTPSEVTVDDVSNDNAVNTSNTDINPETFTVTSVHPSPEGPVVTITGPGGETEILRPNTADQYRTVIDGVEIIAGETMTTVDPANNRVALTIDGQIQMFAPGDTFAPVAANPAAGVSDPTVANSVMVRESGALAGISESFITVEEMQGRSDPVAIREAWESLSPDTQAAYRGEFNGETMTETAESNSGSQPTFPAPGFTQTISNSISAIASGARDFGRTTISTISNIITPGRETAVTTQDTPTSPNQPEIDGLPTQTEDPVTANQIADGPEAFSDVRVSGAGGDALERARAVAELLEQVNGTPVTGFIEDEQFFDNAVNQELYGNAGLDRIQAREALDEVREITRNAAEDSALQAAFEAAAERERASAAEFNALVDLAAETNSVESIQFERAELNRIRTEVEVLTSAIEDGYIELANGERIELSAEAGSAARSGLAPRSDQAAWNSYFPGANELMSYGPDGTEADLLEAFRDGEWIPEELLPENWIEVEPGVFTPGAITYDGTIVPFSAWGASQFVDIARDVHGIELRLPNFSEATTLAQVGNGGPFQARNNTYSGYGAQQQLTTCDGVCTQNKFYQYENGNYYFGGGTTAAGGIIQRIGSTAHSMGRPTPSTYADYSHSLVVVANELPAGGNIQSAIQQYLAERVPDPTPTMAETVTPATSPTPTRNPRREAEILEPFFAEPLPNPSNNETVPGVETPADNTSLAVETSRLPAMRPLEIQTIAGTNVQFQPIERRGLIGAVTNVADLIGFSFGTRVEPDPVQSNAIQTATEAVIQANAVAVDYQWENTAFSPFSEHISTTRIATDPLDWGTFVETRDMITRDLSLQADRSDFAQTATAFAVAEQLETNAERAALESEVNAMLAVEFAQQGNLGNAQVYTEVAQQMALESIRNREAVNRINQDISAVNDYITIFDTDFTPISDVDTAAVAELERQLARSGRAPTQADAVAAGIPTQEIPDITRRDIEVAGLTLAGELGARIRQHIVDNTWQNLPPQEQREFFAEVAVVMTSGINRAASTERFSTLADAFEAPWQYSALNHPSVNPSMTDIRSNTERYYATGPDALNTFAESWLNGSLAAEYGLTTVVPDGYQEITHYQVRGTNAPWSNSRTARLIDTTPYGHQVYELQYEYQPGVGLSQDAFTALNTADNARLALAELNPTLERNVTDQSITTRLAFADNIGGSVTVTTGRSGEVEIAATDEQEAPSLTVTMSSSNPNIATRTLTDVGQVINQVWGAAANSVLDITNTMLGRGTDGSVNRELPGELATPVVDDLPNADRVPYDPPEPNGSQPPSVVSDLDTAGFANNPSLPEGSGINSPSGNTVTDRTQPNQPTAPNPETLPDIEDPQPNPVGQPPTETTPVVETAEPPTLRGIDYSVGANDEFTGTALYELPNGDEVFVDLGDPIPGTSYTAGTNGTPTLTDDGLTSLSETSAQPGLGEQIRQAVTSPIQTAIQTVGGWFNSDTVAVPENSGAPAPATDPTISRTQPDMIDQPALDTTPTVDSAAPPAPAPATDPTVTIAAVETGFWDRLLNGRTVSIDLANVTDGNGQVVNTTVEVAEAYATLVQEQYQNRNASPQELYEAIMADAADQTLPGTITNTETVQILEQPNPAIEPGSLTSPSVESIDDLTMPATNRAPTQTESPTNPTTPTIDGLPVVDGSTPAPDTARYTLDRFIDSNGNLTPAGAEQLVDALPGDPATAADEITLTERIASGEITDSTPSNTDTGPVPASDTPVTGASSDVVTRDEPSTPAGATPAPYEPFRGDGVVADVGNAVTRTINTVVTGIGNLFSGANDSTNRTPNVRSGDTGSTVDTGEPQTATTSQNWRRESTTSAPAPTENSNRDSNEFAAQTPQSRPTTVRTELRLLDVKTSNNAPRALIEAVQRTETGEIITRSIKDLDQSTALEVADRDKKTFIAYTAPRIIDQDTVALTDPATGKTVTLSRGASTVTDERIVDVVEPPSTPVRTSITDRDRTESNGRLTNEQVDKTAYQGQTDEYGVRSYGTSEQTTTDTDEPGFFTRLLSFFTGWLATEPETPDTKTPATSSEPFFPSTE